MINAHFVYTLLVSEKQVSEIWERENSAFSEIGNLRVENYVHFWLLKVSYTRSD